MRSLPGLRAPRPSLEFLPGGKPTARTRTSADARQLVVDLLKASGSRHLNTEQLVSRMLQNPAGPAAISTFQRAIYSLCEQRAIRRVTVPANGASVTYFYELADRAPHMHFYCVQCQHLDEIDDAELMALHARVLTQHGLQQADAMAAISGTCQACRQRAEAPR
jgi:Fur family ferric uptake transcriptional regulator